MTNLINIFEPDAISIGGSFAYYAAIFMEELNNRLKQNFKNRDIPEIIIAKYENIIILRKGIFYLRKQKNNFSYKKKYLL